MDRDIINKKRLLDLFIKLVSIKSPSKKEKDIILYVVKILKELGLEVYVDNSGKEYGSNGGNVIALYRGLSGNKTPIFLGAHLENKNDYILGGDDKVAVAAILEVLRSIKENKIITGDIYIIFTICEEIGLVGAKHVDFDRIPAKYGFVFDADGDIGTIYNQAPYQDSIDVEFKGKPAWQSLK